MTGNVWEAAACEFGGQMLDDILRIAHEQFADRFKQDAMIVVSPAIVCESCRELCALRDGDTWIAEESKQVRLIRGGDEF